MAAHECLWWPRTAQGYWGIRWGLSHRGFGPIPACPMEGTGWVPDLRISEKKPQIQVIL